ncbi:MAG TPA: serine hydrolase domain-containing protein [Mycobacteriales bacterium]|nr:serine hydrolase domain-containing protein [Mycobacteriales bacterium]
MATIDVTHWQERLDALADKHGIVGATLAISQDGAVAAAATGVLNVRTGHAATPECVFQIGSITKVFTATLVMQLVDEGLVDLDAPVVTYLPDFRVRDEETSRTVTTRNLLAHTSGIDGDLFLDTGRGDDAVEKYVAAMADVAQNHPLGATMSYCNSGYIVLGRLIEVLRGGTWDAVMHERVFAPLGLTSAGTLPEEALLHGAATGHLQPPGAPEPVVTPQWGIYRSCGPAGLIHMTAAELLAFARLHLAGGATADGTRVVSAASARAMLEPQVAVPDPWTLGSHWGLGWILMQWDGREVYGHDGATLGQGAFMRVLPDRDLAVGLICNGGKMRELFTDLFVEVFAELGECAMPRPPEPVEEPPAYDGGKYLGRYSRESVTMDVSEGAGGLVLTITSSGPLAETMPQEPQVLTLTPYEPDIFLARMPEATSYMPVVFFTIDDGTRYLHFGARSTPRRG